MKGGKIIIIEKLFFNFFSISILQMDKHLLAYFIGISIVFGSHIMMAIQSKGMNKHAIINLVAGLLIAYYFMNQQGYIKF